MTSISLPIFKCCDSTEYATICFIVIDINFGCLGTVLCFSLSVKTSSVTINKTRSSYGMHVHCNLQMIDIYRHANSGKKIAFSLQSSRKYIFRSLWCTQTFTHGITQRLINEAQFVYILSLCNKFGSAFC